MVEFQIQCRFKFLVRLAVVVDVESSMEAWGGKALPLALLGDRHSGIADSKTLLIYRLWWLKN